MIRWSKHPKALAEIKRLKAELETELARAEDEQLASCCAKCGSAPVWACQKCDEVPTTPTVREADADAPPTL
jgi:hypothetical protein